MTEQEHLKYKKEKAEEVTEILKPLFDEMKLPFEYSLETQPRTFATETLLLGRGYKLNVSANSVETTVGLAAGFLYEVFKDPKGYYNGTLQTDIVGLYYEEPITFYNLMQEKKLLVKDLAKKTGYGTEHIYKVITGREKAPERLLKRLAKALKTDEKTILLSIKNGYNYYENLKNPLY